MKRSRRLTIRRGHIPTPESAARRFNNEAKAYREGRSTRGYNPGGFDSGDIHPMETGRFVYNSDFVGEHDGIELWKTKQGHWAVGKMNYQWWAIPMGDVK